MSLYTLNNNFTSRPLLTSLGTMLGKYALPIGKINFKMVEKFSFDLKMNMQFYSII